MNRRRYARLHTLGPEVSSCTNHVANALRLTKFTDTLIKHVSIETAYPHPNHVCGILDPNPCQQPRAYILQGWREQTTKPVTTPKPDPTEKAPF